MPETTIALRCAVHPGRAATDRCPICARPRCDEDVAAYRAAGCAACFVEAKEERPRSTPQRVIGAGLAGVPVAVIGGWIYAQYVEVQTFSWLVPILIGAGASWACASGWQRGGGLFAPAIVIGVVAGLCGTAFGFRLYPHGPHDPLRPWHEVGLPYLCAIIGAVVWPFVLGPPRRPKPPATG